MTVHKRAHPQWAEFLKQARPQTNWSEVGLCLCLDPGETTGWAIFSQGQLVLCGQEHTGDEPALMAEFIHGIQESVLNSATYNTGLEHIVYEEYRIRGNKALQHIGSEVVTIQHIGVIKATADQLGIPVTKQTAGQVKQFATDIHLRRWGLFQTGKRHANDAIRHGVYWLLFAGGRKPPTR